MLGKQAQNLQLNLSAAYVISYQVFPESMARICGLFSFY
jgi:hypothetical protein